MLPINHLNEHHPKYSTITNWCEISGMGRTVSYEAIGRGDLRAIKVGRRTLIDVDHGLAWLKSLPSAQIRTPKSLIVTD